MKISGTFILLFVGFALADEKPTGGPQPRLFTPGAATVDAPPPALAAQERSQPDPDYILGPGDQITVRVTNLEEISDKPVLIDTSGYIRLPLAGRIKVSGLTVAQVETEVTNRLKQYVKRPDVAVSVAEFHSQPVSVIGSVRTPGVQQVQGRKTLVEMLSLAGGLDPTAGTTLKITRRIEFGKIPLPGAIEDPTGRFSVAQVSLKSIMEARNPEENILVKPYDVISVPRAETVYVIGQVSKSGGFVLNDREKITVLQALAMAGGLDRAARPRDAKILRRAAEGGTRTEIAVDLKRILENKTPDVPMQSDDILFVPNSVPQKAALRAIEAAVQMGTGVVIWRR